MDARASKETFTKESETMTDHNRRENDNVSVGNAVAFLIVIAVFAVGFAGKAEQDRQTIEAVGMVAHKINSCGI